MGFEAIKMVKGTKIEIYCRAAKEEMRNCYDGMEGHQHHYSTIEGQEYDWDTASLNPGNTAQQYGQFPFILYKPL